jgi:CheY-like chemotaxis protein
VHAVDPRRQHPRKGRSAISARARHILLIEDDDNVRQSLRRILELDGHRVEVACDLPEGVELALATAPEVAFIDISLPGIDGYEVARRIRAARGNLVLLVAFTAYGRERDRRRSITAGFDAHLVKPASDEDLTRVLGRTSGGDG